MPNYGKTSPTTTRPRTPGVPGSQIGRMPRPMMGPVPTRQLQPGQIGIPEVWSPNPPAPGIMPNPMTPPPGMGMGQPSGQRPGQPWGIGPFEQEQMAKMRQRMLQQAFSRGRTF